MPEVRRAAERFRTEADGIVTWHSFSYGAHYDPDNVGFGDLVAINEERLAPGAGYDTHRHEGVEIVTLVLDGALAHDDSEGGTGVVRPGQLRHVSAGPRFAHAERNASATEPLRFLQILLRAGATADSVQLVAAARELPGPFLLHVIRGSFVVDDIALGPGDELRHPHPSPQFVTVRNEFRPETLRNVTNWGGSGEGDDHGGVIGGALALAFLAVD